MTQIRMTKTGERPVRPCFDAHLEHCSFGIVSDFEFRYSDFQCSNHLE